MSPVRGKVEVKKKVRSYGKSSQKRRQRATTLKTGRLYPGRTSSGASSACSNASTKLNVVETTGKSTTYNDYCYAVGRLAVWQ